MTRNNRLLSALLSINAISCEKGTRFDQKLQKVLLEIARCMRAERGSIMLLKGRKNLAAFLTCALLTLLVVIPLTFVMIALIQQGVQSVTAIYDWIAAGKYQGLIDHPWAQKITELADKYLPDIQKFFPDFNLQTLKLDQILLGLSSWFGKILVNQGGSLFGNITTLAAKFFLMLFSLFFLA